MKKLVFSLIFVNLIVINYNNFLFSSVIEMNMIDSDQAKIKVASFKLKKSLTLALKRFENHDIYLEYKGDFVRFFIVNISQKDLQKVLNNVRKNFSDAYIYRKRLNWNVKCLVKSSVVNRDNFRYENKKKEKINFLNSDTILQTRKKFY